MLPPERDPRPPATARPGGQMLVHLGLQGGLHQVLGQLGQQTALAHQPQPFSTDLLGRERAAGSSSSSLDRPFRDTGIDFTSAPSALSPNPASDTRAGLSIR
jgi:hypothetical protein